MDHSEGRNDPFTVLRTYLKHPPKVIVYDFACALEEYCMNRDPTWFRNTKFVIDRFHWHNHNRYAHANMALLSHFVCSCGKAFNMSNYPALYSFNSSICEQFHSFIRRFKAAATSMKMPNFMRWMRLWVNVWNSDKVTQIRAASAVDVG
jgi:hypothetical protein